MLNRDQILKLAIFLLDDDNGINSEAWEALKAMLVAADCTEITKAVKSAHGCYYLPEGYADELRKDLDMLLQ